MTVTRQLASLIDRGRLRSAIELAQQPSVTPAEKDERNSAHFYFQYALAVTLSGQDAEPIRNAARGCSDYSPRLEGDFRRDYALQLLRNGSVEEALSQLRVARLIHEAEADKARLGADAMVLGRIYFARGQAAAAAVEHKRAEVLFMAAGHQPSGWRTRNNFHLFRAQAALGRTEHSLYATILATDSRFDHRLRIRLLYRLGRRGIVLDKMIERGLHSLRRLR